MDRRVGQRGAADVARSDLISWSSVWAGVLTAFGLFVLLSVIALAAQLVVTTGTPKFGTAIASIITGVFLVFGFFAGGFVAAWTADVDELESATLHGFLVWTLFLVLLLVLVAAGLGAAFGTFTNVFSANFNPASAADLSKAAWASVFALVLAVVSSILGANIAARDEVRRRWPFAR